jgi:hypothetical protein
MPTENGPGALAGFTYRVLIAVGIIALAVLVWRLSSVLVIVFGGIILARRPMAPRIRWRA